MAITVYRTKVLIGDIGPTFVAANSDVTARVKLIPIQLTSDDKINALTFELPPTANLEFPLSGPYATFLASLKEAKAAGKFLYLDLRIGEVEGATGKELLAIKTQPSTTASTTVAFTIQPAVQLTDAAGNNVHWKGVTITASRTTGTDTLGGTLTALTDDNGVATFTDLKLTLAGGTHTDKLTFTATGRTSSAETGGIAVS